jgi:hypothetical protein
MHAQALREQEPPRSTLVGWLKLNLALTMFVISMVSGIGGALVSATWHIVDAGHDIVDVTRANARTADDVTKLRVEADDITKRLSDDATHLYELRRQRDMELAALAGRVAVLEAQMAFFADRQLPVKPLGPH